MEKMHSLLKRQIKKHLGSEKDIPESWRGLINAVNEAYLQMDIDREMLERSLELSSQELLQANSEMRAVFQAFPDLLVRTSYQGIVLDYQKSDATEFPFLGGKVIGNHIRDIFPKKDSKKLDEAIRQVTGTRALEDIEYTMEEEDREYFYEARLLPLLESEIVILIRDITTRRKAEEALKSSEEMYRILAENAPMGIYYSDFYGTFLYGNKRAEQIVGFRREELIGKNFLNLHLLNPRDLARAAKLLILNRTGKATGPDEFTLNRKDSTQVIVEIYTALITIKGRRVVLGMVHDITERKRVEEAFLTQRERFVTLIQNAPIGIVLIDPDGTFSYINPKFTEILGYDLDDVPHEREWFRKVYPDAALRQKVIDTWLFERDASRPGEGWPRTFSITCKDGTKKTINFIPVKLESGELLMTCEDISERRRWKPSAPWREESHTILTISSQP